MIQHNQLHFMHAKDSDKEEILALYHSLVGTEYCAWTQEYPGEKEFAYDMGRDALFCLKNDKGEIVGTITIDQDPEVEALSCWSKDLAYGWIIRIRESPEFFFHMVCRN